MSVEDQFGGITLGEAVSSTDSLLLIRVYRDQDGALHAHHAVADDFWNSQDEALEALTLAHAATGCASGRRMPAPKDRPVAPLQVYDFRSIDAFEPAGRWGDDSGPVGTEVEILTSPGVWTEAVIDGAVEDAHNYAFFGAVVPVVIGGVRVLWPVNGVRPKLSGRARAAGSQ